MQVVLWYTSVSLAASDIAAEVFVSHSFLPFANPTKIRGEGLDLDNIKVQSKLNALTSR